MEVQQYSEKEGLERIEHHEKWLSKEVLNFVMYGNVGSRCNFMWNYMLDDTDGRYAQVHYLVWHFNELAGTQDQCIEEDKKEVFSDLIQFAEWAIECKVWAMDRHFRDSVTELLKIPQLSGFHKDIRTVWDNYCELATRFGFTMSEDFGFLRVEGKDHDFHSHYLVQAKKLYGEDEYRQKVEAELRKNTSYSEVER